MTNPILIKVGKQVDIATYCYPKLLSGYWQCHKKDIWSNWLHCCKRKRDILHCTSSKLELFGSRMCPQGIGGRFQYSSQTKQQCCTEVCSFTSIHQKYTHRYMLCIIELCQQDQDCKSCSSKGMQGKCYWYYYHMLHQHSQCSHLCSNRKTGTSCTRNGTDMLKCRARFLDHSYYTGLNRNFN